MRYIKFFGLLGLVLFVDSCADKSRTETNNNKEIIADNSEEILLENSFAGGPLNVDNFKTDFADFEIQKVPVDNEQVKGQVDTLLTLTKNTDTLKIKKLPSTQFLIAMAIHTKRIELENKIRLGMPKREFYKAFQQLDTVKNQKDHIRFWMYFSSIQFTFKADTLSEIEWIGGDYD
jgi:hypothetical protein